MEQEECIICLEFIHRESGNYRIELCDKCKFIIHIHCWEEYCKYRGNSYCVVCNKLLDDDKVLPSSNLIPRSPNNVEMVVYRRNISNRTKVIILVIFLILIILFVIGAFRNIF